MHVALSVHPPSKGLQIWLIEYAIRGIITAGFPNDTIFSASASLDHVSNVNSLDSAARHTLSSAPENTQAFYQTRPEGAGAYVNL